MKLYHGTSEAVARLALTEGLLPRAETGDAGNWEENPSHPDLVYLTRAYALYFACQAVPDDDTDGHRWGIVEIDTDFLDEYDLVPDEDYLEQASRGQDLAAVLGDGFPEGDGEAMNERTVWFRDHIQDFAHLWEKSVRGLGNCAHLGPIPPEAVTRVALYDPKPNRMLTMAALDPCIAIINYQFCGARYRALTDWIFGAETDPLIFTSLEHLRNQKLDELPEAWRKMVGPQIKAAKEAVAMRDCIEFLTR